MCTQQRGQQSTALLVAQVTTSPAVGVGESPSLNTPTESSCESTKNRPRESAPNKDAAARLLRLTQCSGKASVAEALNDLGPHQQQIDGSGKIAEAKLGAITIRSQRPNGALPNTFAKT